MVTPSSLSLLQAPAWDFRALARELPDGLPAGALTVVRLPNQSVRRGPWSTVVGQLLLDTLDRCRPAVYIRAGEPYQAWPEEGMNPLGPHYRGVTDTCACCPPPYHHFTARRDGVAGIGPARSTLDNLTAALADHEQGHGPSLALIDNIGGARPFAHLTGGTCHTAAGTSESARPDCARRCATDLLTFAAGRPVAPTVVAGTPGPCVALPDALAEVARLMITALPCERHRPVTLHVEARRSLSAAWPAATEVVLPWFDWGFDERDLDAEDAQAIDQENAHTDDGRPLIDTHPVAEPWAVPAHGTEAGS